MLPIRLFEPRRYVRAQFRIKPKVPRLIKNTDPQLLDPSLFGARELETCPPPPKKQVRENAFPLRTGSIKTDSGAETGWTEGERV